MVWNLGRSMPFGQNTRVAALPLDTYWVGVFTGGGCGWEGEERLVRERSNETRFQRGIFYHEDDDSHK